MEKRQLRSGDSDGFNTLICEEDLHVEDLNSYHISNQNKPQATLFAPGRRGRLAAAILVFLAVLLLIVDVALGVHYSRLAETHLTLEDTENIVKGLGELQEQYKAGVKAMEAAWKQRDDEKNHQQETNWEFEHQRKSTKDYKELIEKLTRELGDLRSKLSKTADGCTRCSPGWVLMNSMCYYFPFSTDGLKSWEKAREFCQINGGDLLVIDTKNKENATVNYLLIHNLNPSGFPVGFWFGLRNLKEEGAWKWLDGTFLVEGYWNDGQPDDAGRSEDCAAVYPNKNFFKAWNDLRCDSTQKWICEKAPTPEFLNGTNIATV